MNWIKETAWPWLRANWQWVLFPIGILLFVLRAMQSRPEVLISDPTEKADERAKIEEETRARALEVEYARLAAEEKAVLDAAAAERVARETQQAGEVDQLRQDPQALADRMRRAGKP